MSSDAAVQHLAKGRYLTHASNEKILSDCDFGGFTDSGTKLDPVNPIELNSDFIHRLKWIYSSLMQRMVKDRNKWSASLSHYGLKAWEIDLCFRGEYLSANDILAESIQQSQDWSM